MVKRAYFHKVRGSKEHISLKIEGKIFIFLIGGQIRNFLKLTGRKVKFSLSFIRISIPVKCNPRLGT